MLYANPALIEILEYDSVEQLLQTNVADFYKQPSQRAEWFRLLLEQGRVSAFEMSAVTNRGNNVICSCPER